VKAMDFVHTPTRPARPEGRGECTGGEEPGLVEVFLPMMPNGRSIRQPVFRPLHLLTASQERATVLEWLERRCPEIAASWVRWA